MLGRLAGYSLWLMGATWRYKTRFIADRSCLTTPCIFVFWHNRILGAPSLWKQMADGTPMAFLTSASKDGTVVEEALRVFELDGIRGSSSRRGVAALMKMCDLMKRGYSISMTPDGPRGPLYRVKEGVIKLAAMSGYPLVPVSFHYESCWRLKKAWDRMCIPKPFGMIGVMLGEPLYVSRDLTDEQLSGYADDLERRMRQGLPDFSPLTFND